VEVDRRELLRQLGLLLAGLGAGAAALDCERGPGRTDSGASAGPDANPSDAVGSVAGTDGIPRALPRFHREALEAACARILPTDRDPGAREANVIEYVDRELARPEYALLKANVLAGAVALRNFSLKTGKKLFTELTEAEQDDVLRQVQAHSEQGLDFIRILIGLTLEGFLGDPIYGGNKGGAGWAMIGYGPGNPDGSGTGGHAH
jgi:gluconate 2-dehydrogenase gamma chain